MVDWQHCEQLLIDASDAALRGFFRAHSVQDICAVGYVFELWNRSEQFDLCLNTHAYFNKSVAASHEKWPEQTNEDEIRWNSGDFEFPAGLPGESYREAWDSWTKESIRLHQLADQEQGSKEVYDGLIAISCTALAKLAKRGLFGDWSKIDFNVSEVGDDIVVVKHRDHRIRTLISNAE